MPPKRERERERSILSPDLYSQDILYTTRWQWCINKGSHVFLIQYWARCSVSISAAYNNVLSTLNCLSRDRNIGLSSWSSPKATELDCFENEWVFSRIKLSSLIYNHYNQLIKNETNVIHWSSILEFWFVFIQWSPYHPWINTKTGESAFSWEFSFSNILPHLLYPQWKSESE